MQMHGKENSIYTDRMHSVERNRRPERWTIIVSRREKESNSNETKMIKISRRKERKDRRTQRKKRFNNEI